ncbi:hypothetical protein [Streptomyces cucumeris]|uniref:hypothetical protein n=1 Tax=Streptomyces cucumeris TaxID=2962890 RepID=UPI0020C8A614|nr:hypothetical protein [Streptomyces sp. NEAU-Y11]MCP9210283.1 hypothetical protein [Streptomyces sp. NEAU-Y11]
MTRSRRDVLRAATAVAGAAAVGATGAGAAAAVTSGSRDTRRVLSSVGTRLNTFHDASGRVTVSVFSHRGNPPQQHWIDETVLVGDGDMVAIGGGATAVESPHGALLTASYPNDDLSGWTVGAKDHIDAQAYELVSYVIGLKIAGMSRDELLRSVYVSRADSGVAPHPEAEAGLPSSNDYVLVGGGFRVDWHGGGNLATASFPATETSWKARSKDHIVSDPANIRAYAIALRRRLPVGTVFNTFTRADAGRAPHPAAVASLTPGYALTGGGAEVHWNGSGNLLWKLEPATTQTPSFAAASKDHHTPDPATLTAWALGIRLG